MLDRTPLVNLAHAARLASRGKRAAAEVARFLLDGPRHLRELDEDLDRRSYRPGPGRSFWIRDPPVPVSRRRPVPELHPVERADFHFPGDTLFTPFERPHGLPIGSLTSQIWANVYLSPIDHLLGSALGLRTFVRYCDDILVYDNDAGRLGEALSRIRARATELRLLLHPDKTRLHRTADLVSFLGFVLRRQGDGVHVRLRHDNVVRMRQRMAGVKALYAVGAIDLREVRSHVMAWLAHAEHGQTRGLLRAELDRLSLVREEE